MKRPILTLRISRRAIGAAVLTGELLTFIDGRHLTSRRARARLAAERYVDRLLAIEKPGGVVLDVPEATVSGIETVAALVASILRQRLIEVLVVHRAEVLSAYGVRPRHSRQELRVIAYGFWPQLQRVAGKVQPYVADAAAAALYAESRLALNPMPT